jgi:predicted nucleotidyltransferase
MLFHVLDALLGTTTKVRVLRALMRLDSPVSGNEAQRLARVRSADSMWKALDDLSDLGILSRDQHRGSHLYRINREHDLFPALHALFAAEGTRLSLLREWVRETLNTAGQGPSVLSVVLYGSNARGDARKESDVDLMVVTTDEARTSPVRQALLAGAPALQARTGLRISPHVLALERIEARYREGDPLMPTIAEEGRVLLGAPLTDVVRAW